MFFSQSQYNTILSWSLYATCFLLRLDLSGTCDEVDTLVFDRALWVLFSELILLVMDRDLRPVISWDNMKHDVIISFTLVLALLPRRLTWYIHDLLGLCVK